jgi:hypothetical protein
VLFSGVSKMLTAHKRVESAVQGGVGSVVAGFDTEFACVEQNGLN